MEQPVRTRVLWFPLLVGVFWFASYAAPSLSGNTTINLSAIPIPCTELPEFKGQKQTNDYSGDPGAPCERTVFSWDLDIALRFTLGFGDHRELWLDAAGGFAGFEHVVIGGRGFLGEVVVKPEVWLAVPFESITVLGLPNAAIIPPGEMLFAAAQIQADWKVDIFRIRWTSVFQDINFPNPGSDFPDGSSYDAHDQNFAMGTVANVSTTVAGDIGVNLQVGLGAEPGAFRVKGYSTSVRAVPGRFYARVSVSNILLTCPWCKGSGVPLDGIRVGLSFAFEPKGETFLRVGGSISLNLFEDIRVSTSFSMVVPEGIKWGGFSINAKTRWVPSTSISTRRGNSDRGR